MSVVSVNSQPSQYDSDRRRRTTGGLEMQKDLVRLQQEMASTTVTNEETVKRKNSSSSSAASLLAFQQGTLRPSATNSTTAYSRPKANSGSSEADFDASLIDYWFQSLNIKDMGDYRQMYQGRGAIVYERSMEVCSTSFFLSTFFFTHKCL
jgi:hypothetical protein